MIAFGHRYLRKRFYGHYKRPGDHFVKAIEAHRTPQSLILDAGCGSTLPYVKIYQSQIIGIDLELPVDGGGSRLVRGNLETLPFKGDSFDLIISRSVFEHLENPQKVLSECQRVLKKGGYGIILTPSRYDYSSVAHLLIPDRWHPWIHQNLLGTAHDAFEAHYRVNSSSAIKTILSKTGLELITLDFITQDPHYLKFSAPFYLLGILYERAIKKGAFFAPLRNWVLFTFRKHNSKG